jgi:hypothetical protein
MSGARATSPVASPPVNGPAAGGVATVRAPENRWPARSAMTASIAMAATAQGRADVADAVSRVLLGGAVRDPTAVPHRWQNRAPGESRERHPEQIASATAAPHSEQKRPVVGAPQLGQALVGVVAEDMRPKLTKRAALRSDARAARFAARFDDARQTGRRVTARAWRWAPRSSRRFSPPCGRHALRGRCRLARRCRRGFRGRRRWGCGGPVLVP